MSLPGYNAESSLRLSAEAYAGGVHRFSNAAGKEVQPQALCRCNEAVCCCTYCSLGGCSTRCIPRLHT
jgi:hypothetical protein